MKNNSAVVLKELIVGGIYLHFQVFFLLLLYSQKLDSFLTLLKLPFFAHLSF